MLFRLYLIRTGKYHVCDQCAFNLSCYPAVHLPTFSLCLTETTPKQTSVSQSRIEMGETELVVEFKVTDDQTIE
jgi:hypothetical protein